MKKEKIIYLDYAATTPLDKEVLQKMMPYLKEKYGNASSIHKFGQEAREAIENSREKIAKFLNCKSEEIIFTGSASESDNLAIRGLIKRFKDKGKKKIHIITSQIEHKAVLETCKDLALNDLGGRRIKVSYISVDRGGVVNLNDLKKEITPETDLVSIMYINNETGAIQPIEKIGKIIAEVNKDREHKIYFHTDAVQAANYLSCNVKKLGVDLLTLSSHKIYGPKGVGILYVRQGTSISSLIAGGSHELGLRAGTENVAGIVGMGFAIEQIKKQSVKDKKQIKFLKDELIKQVLKIPKTKLNGDLKNTAPHIINFSFLGIEGEGLVIALDQEGFALATGSACTSSTLSPSHVLMAMGLEELEAHSSLRVSLGKYTTEKEIDYFLKILPVVVEKLRKISGR